LRNYRHPERLIALCDKKNRLRASHGKTYQASLPVGVISPARAVKGGTPSPNMIYLNVNKLAPKRQVQNNAILILEIFSMA
jgi:hypothetical protein